MEIVLNLYFICFCRQGNYLFKRGTTKVLKTTVKKIEYEVLSTKVKDIGFQERMDIA
jgi:hypothetical protein